MSDEIPAENNPPEPLIIGPEPTAEQLAALINVLGGLAAEVSTLKEETAAENVKRDNRIKWSRRGVVAAIAAAIIGVLVGISGLVVAGKAQQAIDKADAERAARTVGSCKDANERVNQLRMMVADIFTRQGEANVATLVALVPNPDPNPEKTAASIKKLKEANVVNTTTAISAAQSQIGFKHLDGSIYPQRDCTLAGIDAFFEEQTAIAAQDGDTLSSDAKSSG